MKVRARNETVTEPSLMAEEFVRMAGRAVPILALLILTASATGAAAAKLTRSRAVVGEDGGYSGVTVRISDDVPEEDCADIIQNLKVGKAALLG